MKSERHRPLDNEFEMPVLRLDGQVALVTGGSRGLGLGMALALAHAGADVALAARTVEQLERAAEMIRDLGQKALVVPTNLRDISTVRAMIRDVGDHFERLDVLVNAAGINIRKPADSFTEGDWDQLLTINLKAVFFACQEAAQLMRRQGKGKIINVGSITFEQAIPNIALYSISKGGLRQLTRALAIEWAADNINVNAIAPGRFWTQMTDAVFSDPELHANAVSVIPQGRPGIPSDLAGATLLLASSAGDYITGETIFVDGGWLANAGVKS